MYLWNNKDLETERQMNQHYEIDDKLLRYDNTKEVPNKTQPLMHLDIESL